MLPPILSITIDGKYDKVLLDHVREDDMCFFIAQTKGDNKKLIHIFNQADVAGSVAFMDNPEEHIEEYWRAKFLDIKAYGLQTTLFDCLKGPAIAKCYLAKFSADQRIDAKQQQTIEAKLIDDGCFDLYPTIKYYILAGTNSVITLKKQEYSSNLSISMTSDFINIRPKACYAPFKIDSDPGEIDKFRIEIQNLEGEIDHLSKLVNQDEPLIAKAMEEYNNFTNKYKEYNTYVIFIPS